MNSSNQQSALLSESGKMTSHLDLDVVLGDLGSFGKFQKRNFAFICVPIIFTACFVVSYVFTARNTDYRCFIPECDSDRSHYRTPWLPSAVPYVNPNIPSRCLRYRSLVNTSISEEGVCSADTFDQNRTATCHEFVFASDYVSIVQDFDITCDDNLWMLTLVGTINNVGQFICHPTAGLVSDRWGRRNLLAGGLLLSSFAGLARSFSPSYIWFVSLEFLDSLVGSATYSSGYILALELVGPEKRVLSSTIISCCFALGEAIMGLLAWASYSWRQLLQMAYTPSIIIIIYFWIAPESVRWLLSKGRHDDAKNILRKAAQINGVNISEETLNKLKFPEKQEETKRHSVIEVFKSIPLVLRLINCAFCWITCNFVYYGLSLNSVAISGNIHLNFILVSLIEIPGYIITQFILDRVGRRLSLCVSLLLSGAACFGFIFVPEDFEIVRLVLFLCGKLCITVAFTVIYLYTTELFPTPLRHSLVGTCSMFGRVGSMVAPQTPLLAQVLDYLPLLMFGSMSTLAGFLVLAFPETVHTKLPDTIEEAETIGKRNKT